MAAAVVIQRGMVCLLKWLLCLYAGRRRRAAGSEVLRLSETSPWTIVGQYRRTILLT
jgi:hypothetical protein